MTLCDSLSILLQEVTEMNSRKEMSGFTLIELLIVVAIISILAAIAVPNFLEAQIRSKVARVRSDLRTISTGLEAYAVDWNKYPPNDGWFNVLPIQITTPIAYITTGALIDPFMVVETDPDYGDLIRQYTYTKLLTEQEAMRLLGNGDNTDDPPVEAIDSSFFNEGVLERCGQWRLLSYGPDLEYGDSSIPLGPYNPNPSAQWGSDIPYDATNGSLSWGNIIRTQKNPEGVLITDY